MLPAATAGATGIVGRAAGCLPLPAQLLRQANARGLEPLVSVEHQAALARLAEHFAVPVQTACYECRLAPGDRRVDLALCVFRGLDPRLGDALAELRSKAGSDPRSLRTLRLLQRWSALDPEFVEIPFVWVAFDLEPDARELPLPCLGLCVDGDFFARRLGLPVQEPRPGDLIELARPCHHALADHGLSAETRALIERALTGLGGAVAAKHFSYMSSRSPATFKLDVRLPVARLREYLTHIGWPGPAAEIEDRVHGLVGEGGHLQLNLVLEPALSQPLEVELITDPADATPERRESLLDGLVGMGLCSAAKADALAALAREPGLGARQDADFAVGVSWYIKVRFLEGRASEAKAYVGLMPKRWGATS